MFKEDRDKSGFKWENLGNIEEGRANLGPKMPIWAYRLMQYTFRDALINSIGPDKANKIMIEAGNAAGQEFCRNMLNTELDFNEFIANLQYTLQKHHIGILRIEKADLETMNFTITVAEDLDCSGLPFTDEVVCQYDEGFLAGILENYTGKTFLVKEIDCWASGDRVCRFEARILRDIK